MSLKQYKLEGSATGSGNSIKDTIEISLKLGKICCRERIYINKYNIGHVVFEFDNIRQMIRESSVSRQVFSVQRG